MCSVTRNWDRETLLAAVQRNGDALCHASAELQEDDAILQAANHIFAELDRLADRGQLKVLRTLASVRECGRQMNNCLAGYDLVACRRHIHVKLDGDDGIPLAVGSFVNGEWEQIRYAESEFRVYYSQEQSRREGRWQPSLRPRQCSSSTNCT